MHEDPDLLIDDIAAAVRAGDDHRIRLLVERLKEIADIPVLMRLRRRLYDAAPLHSR
ncbi:hypothetical protein [Streptomyces sp. CB00455]|uniref:hypothetical protein n=1 Tax=Streptomyces sp. CB00455 TaxID=1703927 RepID=UPI00130147FC|nr:hypothetical protein [Streptomyces sp. CB00455]